MIISTLNPYIHNPTFGKHRQLQKLAKVCAYCGGEFSKDNPVTIDHIVPKSKHGESKITNYVASCFNCNHNLKKDMDTLEFLKQNPERVTNIFNYLRQFNGKIINGINYTKVITKKIIDIINKKGI